MTKQKTQSVSWSWKKKERKKERKKKRKKKKERKKERKVEKLCNQQGYVQVYNTGVLNFKKL